MEPISTALQHSKHRNIIAQLDERVQHSVAKRDFSQLSEAQERAIPPILKGKHTLLIAPTGTGKTESAMLPVFHHLLSTTGPGLKALYITPLRSLNRDILGRLEWWCDELGLKVGVRHGDTPQSERRKQALNPPDLLVTTPETLQALFMGKRLREHLKNIRYVIIDEIHELADSKRGAQLSIALERLVRYAGEFQRIALSATVGNPHEIARFMCNARPYELIQIPVSQRLDLAVRFAGTEFPDQVKEVAACMDRSGSTLVFVNTRSTAEALGHQLYERGDVEVHHGSLSKEVRIDAEERFKRHDISTLICTSSMELGIDIGHVEHVVQFGSPREVARLIQRVGRAGHQLHAISEGTILTTGFDDLMESLVIARRARENECEDIRLHYGAADVIANQIAALAVEYGTLPLIEVQEIICNACCFAGCAALVEEAASQMASHNLIWIQDGLVTRTGRTRKYLASNLSMIHDERKVQIFDIVSRRTVGTLDESFVVGWVHTGAVFITKGQAWQVMDIDEGKILVAPAQRMTGELPSWEGEQIPVPYAVAQEVGALRRIRDLAGYKADERSLHYLRTVFRGVDCEPSPVPTDTHLSLEYMDGGAVLNVCAGHKANEAIARAISILLSARFGSTVGIEVGAYRICFRLPAAIHASDIMDVMESLDPAHIRGILSLAMKRTALFKWKLVQIAKKFGAIDIDADYERISIHRLIDMFEDTVIQQETYRELFTSIMDVEKAERIFRGLREGSLSLSLAPISTLGREGLSSSKDMIPPPAADMAVLNTLKRRLENDHILLFCMNCKKWKSKTQVMRVPDPPVCPLCGARLICALKPWEDDLIGCATRKKKTAEDTRVEAKLLKNANIVLSSGRMAVIALSARGVGPEAASRILFTLKEGDDFYREILRAERTYIRTHKFWRDSG